MRNRMECSARDALNPFVASGRTNAPNYFARRSPREGQKKYSFGRDSTLEKEFNSRTQSGGLSRTGSCENSQRAVAERGRFTLTIVELLSNWGHVSEATEGLSYAIDRARIMGPRCNDLRANVRAALHLTNGIGETRRVRGHR
jgi:hypothetical protein